MKSHLTTPRRQWSAVVVVMFLLLLCVACDCVYSVLYVRGVCCVLFWCWYAMSIGLFSAVFVLLVCCGCVCLCIVGLVFVMVFVQFCVDVVGLDQSTSTARWSQHTHFGQQTDCIYTYIISPLTGISTLPCIPAGNQRRLH